MATFVRTQSLEHRIGASGHLNVRVTGSDTTIRAVAGDSAHVRATYQISASSETDSDRMFEELRLQVTADVATLELEEPKGLSRSFGGALSRLLGGAGGASLELEIEAPADCELRFEGISADVQASGLHGNQRFQTISGDVLLRDAGGTVRIDDTSGDITIRADDALALQTSAVSGDLSVIAPRITALRVNSVSGDVELEGAFARGGEHRIETVSGDVAVGLVGGAIFDVRGLSTDISSRLPHEIEGRSDQRRVIIGDGATRIRFNSMSGDLSIGAPRRLVAEPAEVVEEEAAEMAILQALERGDIDVEEAGRRLAEIAGE
jgi:DUF4097 and DUF4098 domain-containing protein YvlB